MCTAARLAGPVVVCFYFVTGCTESATDSSDRLVSETQPIIGGGRDFGDRAVVAIRATTGSNVCTCTGTVIGPRSVLTAAHCVGGKPSCATSSSSFEVLVGSDLSVAESHTVSHPPEFDQAYDNADPFQGHDIGCVRLDTNIGVPALPYNRNSVGAGSVRIVGFGADTPIGTGAGVKRTAITTFGALTANLIPVGGISTGQDQCVGDSGGPTLQTIDGAERIIGVGSFVFGDGRRRLCVSPTWNTRVDAYKEFADRCACVPPPDGMVAWWPGDDNNPQIATDIARHHDGSLFGGVTYTDGEVSRAFSFDGATGHVSVPDATDLNFGVSDVTVEAWIKAPPEAGPQTFFGKEEQTYPYPSIIFRLNDGTLNFFVTDCGTGACGFGASRLPVVSSRRVDDGVFHHVAGIRHSDGRYELFVDGQLDGTRQEPARNGDNTTSLLLGGQSSSGQGVQLPFTGVVDEATLYSRALSADEIQGIFAAGSAGKCK